MACARILKLFVVTWLLAACTPVSSPSPTVTTPGDALAKPGAPAPPQVGPPTGRLVVAMGSLTTSLEPNAFVTPLGKTAFSAMFDGLTDLDAKNEARPALATSWTSIDASTWEFALRSGVKFHNGEDLTADSVVATFKHVLDPVNKQAVQTWLTPIKSVTSGSAAVVRVVTNEPDPLLVKRLSLVYILSAKQLAAGVEAMGKQPFGTGPYKFVSFERNQALTMEAWTESWRGTPRIKEIVLRHIPESAVALSAFRTGEIDLIQQLSPDHIDSVKSVGGQVVSAVPGRVALLHLDHLGPGPFRDKRVRLAVNYAIDREAILKGLYVGYGKVPQGQLVTEDGFGFDPSLKSYPFDPQLAKRLLAEAGYPGGFSTKLHSTQGFFLNDQGLAQTVVAYLGQVGIKVENELLERSAWLDRFYNGGRDPLFLESRLFLPLMDLSLAIGSYRGTEPEGARRFQNSEFDALFIAQAKETDPKSRLRLLQQASRILYEEVPFVLLIHNPDLYGIGGKVRGFVGRADQVISFDAMRKDG